MKRIHFTLALWGILISGSAGAATLTLGPYQYDGAGNVKEIGPDDKFTYDAFGRITYGTAGLGWYERYKYDPFGNLIEIRKEEQAAMTLGADPVTNRMDRTDKQFFAQYDNAGRITKMTSADPAGNFQYDGADMVKELTVGGVRKIHLYTASDERIVTITVNSNNDEVRSDWSLRDSGNRVLRRLERSGGPWKWTEDYIYRGGALLAAVVDASPGVLHFHPDHLGTPRLITGNGGVEVSRHTYYPFGAEVQRQTAERLKFTGHERDFGAGAGTDLDYMHARFYSPVWARFLSVDPVLDLPRAMREPQMWNRYAYVTNNPLRYTDPDGGDRFMAWLLGEAFGDVDTLDALKGALTGEDFGPAMKQATEDWAEDHRKITGGFSPVPTSKTEIAMIPVFMGVGKVANVAFNGIIRSVIKNDTFLVKAARFAGKSHQSSLDNLVGQLAKGNLNPGIGTKNLFGNIMYARSRDGARVFFRQGRDGSIEILAKANKANEKAVIVKLTELYR